MIMREVFTYINKEVYLNVLIAEVGKLKNKLQPSGTGDLHTTIAVLNRRIEELSESI